MSAVDWSKHALTDDEVEAVTPAPRLITEHVVADLGMFLGAPGELSIVSNNNWDGRKFSTDERGIAQAVRHVMELHLAGAESIHVRDTTVVPGTPGRGTDDETSHWIRFGEDLDFVSDSKVGYPPDESTVWALVESCGLPPTSARQRSGHGVYPYFILSEPVPHSEDVAQFARDLDAVIRAKLAGAGYDMDNTSDAARVRRVAGTVNGKYSDHPAQSEWIYHDGPRCTYAELRAAIPVGIGGMGPTKKAQLATGELDEFVKALPGGEPCKATRTTLDTWMQKLRTAGDRHPTARDGILGLLRAGERRHAGVPAALDELKDLFLARCAEDGTEAGREYAWEKLISGGVAIVKGDPTPAAERGCKCGGGHVPLPSLQSRSVAAQGNVGATATGTGFDMSPFVLPAEFWAATPQLSHVQAAALASFACPDAVLQFTLARIAALSDHNSRVHTGAGLDDGASVLSYFVTGVGSSGTGKTTAESCTTELLRSWVKARELVMPTGFYREVRLGTGEGLIEAFMTHQEIPRLDKNGNQAFNKKGEPLVSNVKQQTRHNLLVRADEGRKFLAIAGRQNATISGTICELWMGSAAGDQNAHAENQRDIAEKSYVVAMTLGFQTANVTGLFADTEGGAPQRFVFVPVNNPYAPEVIPEWPGDLIPALPRGPVALRLGEAARAEVRAERLASIRGSKDFGLDGHRMLARARMAALLAQLHGETGVVSDLMWWLAGAAMDRSAALRDALADIERQERAREAEGRHAATVRTQVESSVRSEEMTRVRKAADALVLVVEKHNEAEGPLTEGRAKNKLPKTLRPVSAAGLELALAEASLVRKLITGGAEGGPREVTVLALPEEI